MSDPRHKIIREFLWREVLDDTKDGRPTMKIYRHWADDLLAKLDAVNPMQANEAPK